MISEVKAIKLTNSNTAKNTQQQTNTNKTTPTRTKTGVNTDVVELGTTQDTSVIYAKPTSKKTETYDIKALKAQADRANANLRSLVEKILLKQGNLSDKSANKQDMVQISQEDIEQAKLSISDDGVYGIKTVSDNIVNFAITISGNDTEKLSELKSAIDKGFKEAEKSFGGKLPDICYDTYDEVMKKLDQWSNSKV